MPGMKWSTVLAVASIGTRAIADQARPSVEVLMTMSLLAQRLRNRQSCQTTYTLPAASTSAEGNGPDRRFPASAWSRTRATVTVRLQLAPPSVERLTTTAAPSGPLGVLSSGSDEISQTLCRAS